MPPQSESRPIVLVVDDSPESLSLLTDALEESGYMALVARSGNDALTLLENASPDIILMDAVMPGTDGFETCATIKKQPLHAHIPVIFMTGLSETEHIVRGFNAGGVDYLTKPVDPVELIARIQAHIATSRLTSDARVALDMSGSSLMAVNDEGEMIWATPAAQAAIVAADGIAQKSFAGALQEELRSAVRSRASGSPIRSLKRHLLASYLGELKSGEHLIVLREPATVSDNAKLKEQLNLTDREAEVLLWTAQGKSNRDIADILSCSPRTVNKHLETIYSKLNVENRTAAAMIAVRILAGR